MDISKTVTNKNRVAFVIHGLPMGGAEKFLISIVNDFQKNRKNPLLILLSDDNDLMKEVDQNVEILKIIKKHRFDIGISKRIKNEIKIRNIEKIFCVNMYSFFLTKISYVFDKNVKFYLSPHTTLSFSTYHYLQNLIYTRVIDKNDTIIYLCNNQNKYYRKKYGLIKNKEMIVHNGVDTSLFDPNIFSKVERNKIKKEIGISENDKIILMVARIEKEKNHKIAILSLSKLIEKINNRIHLIFVGSGDISYIQELKMYSENLNVKNYIHFVGSSKNVGEYYQAADVFTLTSKSETFSIAALEAMSFGIPCALTNVGGANEMIKKNINGNLMKSNDSDSIAATWKDVLHQKYEKEEIRKNIKNKFSIEKMLIRYNNILN